MCGLDSFEMLWGSTAAIVLGAIGLVYIALVLGTLIHDFLWYREHRRRAEGHDEQPARPRTSYSDEVPVGTSRTARR